MWQLLWVNFNSGIEKLSQTAVRRNYHLRLEQSKTVSAINYLAPFTDMDKDEIDEEKKTAFATARIYYPFSAEEHSCLIRPIVSHFAALPAAVGKFNGRAYMVFVVNDIKQTNHVLRLIPEPEQKDNLVRILQKDAISNLLKSIDCSWRDFEDAELYHVKQPASMAELMCKFYLGIPLADVSKLVHLENRIYTAQELRDINLGELKLSRHGTEIPIIEQLAPDEFMFYEQNYLDWKEEIEKLILK
jgi:hypothetical protein